MIHSLVVGRDPTCDIVVDDEYASPHHCRISRVGDRYFVEDLGSTNGTRIRRGRADLRVTGPTPLVHGDAVVVGRTVIPWGTQTP